MKSRVVPIALFVYNRPLHTKNTLAALARNYGASEHPLFIFSDGAKTPSASTAVEEVRKIIRDVQGFKSVTLITREKNIGLAESIISGVREILDKFTKVIVLEDDLVTSPFFLEFMCDALDQYENCEKVMHVSGYSFPVKRPDSSETFFLTLPMCWGWATWSRAWSGFERDLNLFSEFSDTEIKRFNFENSNNYWSQYQLNLYGTIKTWFVFWYAYTFQRKGLSLFPAVSLVQNNGLDNTGENCVASSDFDVVLGQRKVRVDRIILEERQEWRTAHEDYFRGIKGSIFSELKFKLKLVRENLKSKFA